jgi:2-polyprenyl-6-methoxyphenol hydroxylase-like FAD-dependent oxidoreductase
MTSEQFDVVVVGARCSGAPLAALLARRGLRVCLLDKARFPSDTASTHIIQPRGSAVLERLGVAATLRDAGAAAIERLTLAYDDARLDADYTTPQARSLLSTGATLGMCVRRTILDQVLVDAARASGADVRTSTGVTGLSRNVDDRVVGVQTDSGPIGARVVVGADGRHSSVARFTGAREYAQYQPGRLAAWGYFEGAQDDGNRLRIGRFGEHAFVATPAGSGLYLAGYVPSMSRKDEFLADREGNFARGIQAWPELAGIIAGADRVGPLRVVPDWRGYFRQSAGPGWALVGDAGNFKDPSAAQGITDALRQAEQLADAVASGLDVGGSVDARTESFWRWRDRDCREMHWFAADMGAPGPTKPVTTEVLRDVAGTERTSIGLLQVLNRDVTPSQMLTPRRLARSATRALRQRPHRVRAVMDEIANSATDEISRRRRPANRA